MVYDDKEEFAKPSNCCRWRQAMQHVKTVPQLAAQLQIFSLAIQQDAFKRDNEQPVLGRRGTGATLEYFVAQYVPVLQLDDDEEQQHEVQGEWCSPEEVSAAAVRMLLLC